MTLAQLKKAYKAHYYFINRANKRAYKMYDISQDMASCDNDYKLRTEIYNLTWELKKKIKEFYGPKLGEKLMVEELEK